MGGNLGLSPAGQRAEKEHGDGSAVSAKSRSHQLAVAPARRPARAGIRSSMHFPASSGAEINPASRKKENTADTLELGREPEIEVGRLERAANVNAASRLEEFPRARPPRRSSVTSSVSAGDRPSAGSRKRGRPKPPPRNDDPRRRT
jgi:hypothetical protein